MTVFARVTRCCRVLFKDRSRGCRTTPSVIQPIDPGQFFRYAESGPFFPFPLPFPFPFPLPFSAPDDAEPDSQFVHLRSIRSDQRKT